MAADTEITHWLAEMSGKPLLPCLAVTDLVAVGKTITVRVNATSSVAVECHAARARGIVGILTNASVYSMPETRRVRHPADVGIIFFTDVACVDTCEPVRSFSSRVKDPFQI